MSFPEIRFGICQVCGSKGSPQEDDLTDADAPARTTEGADGYDPGNGVILMMHKGRLMCEVCKNEDKADVESRNDAKRHANNDRFISKAGFTNTVEE